MKICFIADVRSPIARNWIQYFPARGHEVHVLATHDCNAGAIPGATLHALVPGSKLKRNASTPQKHSSRGKYLVDPSAFLGRSILGLRANVLQPMKCLLLTNRARHLVRSINPDLLHALRIPIEGEVGARLGVHPFIISIWGNDLTLYAAHSIAHRILTRHALEATDGLVADAQIDIERAREISPNRRVPTLRVPGCGGIKSALFSSGRADQKTIGRLGLASDRPLVLNPRGFRRYVRNDTFFAAIPKVLAQRPEVQFVAVGMLGWKRAENWVARQGLASSVVLTPQLSQQDLAELYRAAWVTVSPAEHDGTPNTLLEAMASGCLPICGDLPSIREWITHDVNGLLIDPGDHNALATSILRAIWDGDLRESAAARNIELIAREADYEKCMRSAEIFYDEVAHRCRLATVSHK